MIVIDIDLVLARFNSLRKEQNLSKMMLKELADNVGIAPENMSRLKNGDFTMIRRSTLDGLCRVLQCQPGELFRYVENGDSEEEVIT